jgi:hypothetical protein
MYQSDGHQHAPLHHDGLVVLSMSIAPVAFSARALSTCLAAMSAPLDCDLGQLAGA